MNRISQCSGLRHSGTVTSKGTTASRCNMASRLSLA